MQFGPGDAKAVLVGQRQQRLRALLALGVAAFAELRGVDQRAFQAVRRGLGERVDDATVGMMVSARSTGSGIAAKFG